MEFCFRSRVIILFPVCSIHKLTSLAHLVEEKLDLESFKFCFTVASSLIAELLEKYRHQKRSLRHFVHQLVSVVQNEAIEDCLLSLGLYEPSQASGNPRRPQASRSEVTSSQRTGLNLTREFATAQRSLDSDLAKFCDKLFQSKDGWDMEFEIVDDSGADLEERTNAHAHSSVVKVRFCFRCHVSNE